jgi:hypothetical protein
MSPAHIAPQDVEAIEFLVGKFALLPEHAHTLLELASGDQVLAESALLVAREMGYESFAGARNYIVDILRLPSDKMPAQTT